jgi:multiple sugar transport system substrate-binding protein
MKANRLLLTILVALMTAALAFAAGQAEEGDAMGGEAEEEIVLRFSWWGGETRHNALLEAMDLFMERNPNITIEGEFSGWSGYIDKLRTQMAAGEQPDVFYNGYDGPWQVLPMDGRAPLNEHIDDGIISTDQISDAQLSQITFDGDLMGLPRSASVRGGYLINKTLFDELGIDIPDYTWTWEDFADVAIEVYEKSDGEVYGTLDEAGGISYGSFGKRAWMLSHFDRFMMDGEGIVLSEEQLTEYYSWWTELREAGGASAAEVTVSADDNQNSPIVDRGVGMLALSLGSYARFQSNTQDNLVMVPFPQGEYPNNEIGAGVSASLSSATDHPEAAAQFLDFIINDVEAGMILGTEVGIPANAERRRALLEEGLDPAGEVVFNLNNWIVDNLETIPQADTHPDFNEFRDRYWAEEQRLAFGRASVEETVDAIIQIAEDMGHSVAE